MRGLVQCLPLVALLGCSAAQRGFVVGDWLGTRAVQGEVAATTIGRDLNAMQISAVFRTVRDKEALEVFELHAEAACRADAGAVSRLALARYRRTPGFRDVSALSVKAVAFGCAQESTGEIRLSLQVEGQDPREPLFLVLEPRLIRLGGEVFAIPFVERPVGFPWSIVTEGVDAGVGAAPARSSDRSGAEFR